MSTLRRAVVLAVVAVGVLLVVAEVAGRVVVQRAVEQQLRDAGAGAQVEVVVGQAWWKPSVLPVLLGGHLDRVEVQLRDAEMYPITVAVAEYVLRDLDVSVDPFGRDVSVSSSGPTRVRLLVDPTRLGVDLGIEVQVVAGEVRLGPDALPAGVELEGDHLVVTSEAIPEEVAEGGSLRLAAVDPYVLPCRPNVQVGRGLVTLRCIGDELPGMIRQHLAPDAGDLDDLEDLPPGPVELGPPASLDLDDPDDPPGGADTTSTTTSTTTPGED